MARGKNAWIRVENPNGTVTRTPNGVPTIRYNTSDAFRAVVAPPTQDEQEQAGDQRGFGTIDAVVRLSNDCAVTLETRVVVAGGTPFDGDFAVVGIRPNRLDARVMLRRRTP